MFLCLLLLVDKVITIDQLDEVYEKVFDAKNKWYNLGLALKVGESTLTSIKKKCHDTPEDCLREMLAHRLNTAKLTWDVLCTALRKKTVGHNVIADEIETESLANKGNT